MLKNVKLRTVLEELLIQVGGDVPLRFAIGDRLLRIASKEKLDRNKRTLVYDVRDLIVKIPQFARAPLFDEPAGNSDGGEFVTFGSNQAMFGSQNGGDGESEGPNGDIANEIINIVRANVEPDSWRASGGGDGSIHELNGQLIVYNTSEAHQQTRSLLGQLREARALMVGVESRFLIVSSNFLEEIGVDLDFVFNSATAGYDPAFTAQNAPITDPFTGAQVLIPRPLSSIGTVAAIPAVGGNQFGQTVPTQPYANTSFVPQSGGILPTSSRMTPITGQQGSLNLADPRALNTGIPGSFATQGLTPALNIAGSFLDNLQVDFLIRATQANRRSSIVQAPRLMMFNGQRAWVAVVRNRQYVSSVTPSVAEGRGGRPAADTERPERKLTRRAGHNQRRSQVRHDHRANRPGPGAQLRAIRGAARQW